MLLALTLSHECEKKKKKKLSSAQLWNFCFAEKTFTLFFSCKITIVKRVSMPTSTETIRRSGFLFCKLI